MTPELRAALERVEATRREADEAERALRSMQGHWRVVHAQAHLMERERSANNFAARIEAAFTAPRDTPGGER